MHQYPKVSFFVAYVIPSLATLSIVGCSAPAAEPTGTVEEAAVVQGPRVLAREVANLLKGPEGACKQCHQVTRDKVRRWGEKMQAVQAACLDQPGLTAQQRVDCLRTEPSSGTSPFAASKLGLYAAGAAQPQFANLFDQAYGAQGPAQHQAFVQRVSMPLGGAPLSAAQFAKIKAWVLRGMPNLDDAAFDDGVNPPQGCQETAPSADLLAHLDKMKAEGWGARLAELATPMFGCGPSGGALGCLTAQADVTAQFAEAAAGTQKVRQLHRQGLQSNYWIRSSADGRYVGFGLLQGANIIDLKRPDVPIRVAANYDPYFFPSNDGFSFAGADADQSIRACRQSLLADVGSLPAPTITLEEPKCARVVGAVYQSIGSALDGQRYFVTVGEHFDDDGGNDITGPTPAPYDQNAKTRFLPMTNNGQSYQAGQGVDVTLPREGDAMLSPSSLLVGTRFAASGDKQAGFRVRFVKAQTSASGALSVQTPLASELCFKGGKPTFSFDERFVAAHQYVGASDPTTASLPNESANIVLADLRTGKKTRLTKMAAGQYALYPHFRADGWLYFLVRDMNANVEYVLATDAALRAAN
jgi:hypothetical protein